MISNFLFLDGFPLQIVKVWDIITGKIMFEFSANMGKDVTVTSMDVDRTGKRYDDHVILIFTGHACLV